MIRLKSVKIELFDFYKYLDHYRLAWDWWSDLPDLAKVQHAQRYVFEILRKGECIGLAWVAQVFDDTAGKRVHVGICVDKGERRRWTPGDVAIFYKLFEFAFRKWKVDRIGVVMPDDRKVAERFFKDLGFRFESRILDAARVRGKLINTISLGLTRNFYNKIKGGMLRGANDYDGIGNSGRQRNRCTWRAVRREQEAAGCASRAVGATEDGSGAEPTDHGSDGGPPGSFAESSGQGNDLEGSGIDGREIRSAATA